MFVFFGVKKLKCYITKQIKQMYHQLRYKTDVFIENIQNFIVRNTGFVESLKDFKICVKFWCYNNVSYWKLRLVHWYLIIYMTYKHVLLWCSLLKLLKQTQLFFSWLWHIIHHKQIVLNCVTDRCKTCFLNNYIYFFRISWNFTFVRRVFGE